MQRILKDYTKYKAILKKIVRNCKINKKYNYKYINLDNNFFFNQKKVFRYCYKNIQQNRNNILNLFFAILENSIQDTKNFE